MFSNDERAAQWNHHQYAEQSAQNRHEHYAGDFEIKTEDQDRRHRYAETESDGLARRTGGLDDVILQNVGITETELRNQTKDRDGDDGDRNRGAHGQAHFEDEIQRRRTEN